MTPSHEMVVVNGPTTRWRRPVKSSESALVVMVSPNSSAQASWKWTRAAVVVDVMRESSTWSWTMSLPR